MTPRVHARLRKHFAEYRHRTYNGKPSPWVFHHLVNQRKHLAGRRIGKLYNALKAAAKRAGIDPADGLMISGTAAPRRGSRPGTIPSTSRKPSAMPTSRRP